MHPTRTSIAKTNVVQWDMGALFGRTRRRWGYAARSDARIIMGNDEAALVRSRSLVKAAQGRE
jgi:hypothetical protein